ncbi:MAG: ABC transporter ATP-binding protein [Gammaproteobacteria bacterium]|nr:ABC transporter ATP-binding protein [Gammaproteobacteria bacterium]
MAQIICNNLSIGYENNIIVNNLNFEINKGDYLAIVGENGAGKSTLIKTLLGLLKPISGSIEFGESIKRTDVGYLPQQTIVQKDFPASIYEVVISGFISRMGLRPFYTKKEKEIALSNINRMGLSGMEKRSYRELSGGQQQRVLLARALCATDKIIILDEPVAGLDPKVTEEMYELISSLNKDGTTIIMISHDLTSAIEYSNKILHIGKDSYFGTKEEYIKSELGQKFINVGGKHNG